MKAGNSLRPIIVLGPGRSGTTLLLRLLARHEDLGWISSWTARFDSPRLAGLSRLARFRSINSRAQNWRLWPRPSETYRVWNRFAPGFSAQDLSASDLDPAGFKALTRWVEIQAKWQGKNRFLLKFTGWPRMNLLLHLWPDANLLYLDRDPRAVVYSYFKRGWHWNAMDADAFKEMSRLDRLAFCAERYVKYYKTKLEYDPSLYLQLHYEDLVDNSEVFLRRICEYGDLPFSSSFLTSIRDIPIRAETNEAGLVSMKPEELSLIEEILAEPLTQLGYSVSETKGVEIDSSTNHRS